VPTPEQLRASFHRGGYACFIIAAVPAVMGVLLLALVPGELNTVARIGPFAWTAALVGIGVGLLRQSVAAIWAAMVLAVGATAALLFYAVVSGGSKTAVIVPAALAFIAVPRLWRLRKMALAAGP
jgi:hypothetical protein